MSGHITDRSLKSRPPEGLINTMRDYCHQPVSPQFEPLLEAIRERFNGALAAVIAYGSCLRDADPATGVVDLYVVVDNYRDAYDRAWLRWLNSMLPPNVFYLERYDNDQWIRAKYAVISLADLEAGASRGLLPTLWGRFSQPVRVLAARDSEVDEHVCTILATATLTFLGAVAPVSGHWQNLETLWSHGLALSYATELRPERRHRAQSLVIHDLAYYQQVTDAALPALAPVLENEPSTGLYYCGLPEEKRRRVGRLWRYRCWLGRLRSIVHFAKAALTFNGSVDYAAWKIERHTGVSVEVTPQLRKYPLLFGWTVVWRLFRQGVLH